jgi:hypothetical protein
VGDYRAPGVVRVEQRPASRRRRVSLIEDVELLCPQILAHPWDPADMPADSPAPIPKALADQSAGLLRLFRPRDTVWIGHLCDSGRPWHRDHFRTAEEWLAADRLPPGPRICTSSFKPGEYRRTQSYVRARRFLVVESDGLDLPSQGAILRWLSKAGLKLRAIVHSGGRSLHGWFDFPCATDLVDLRLLLPALGCDPALFSAVQPVRLPGWRRPDLGTIPRLLYLSP